MDLKSEVGVGEEKEEKGKREEKEKKRKNAIKHYRYYVEKYNGISGWIYIDMHVVQWRYKRRRDQFYSIKSKSSRKR